MADLRGEIDDDGLADGQDRSGHAGHELTRGHRHDGVRGEPQGQRGHGRERQGAAQDRPPPDDVAGAAQGRYSNELEDARYQRQPLVLWCVVECRNVI